MDADEEEEQPEEAEEEAPEEEEEIIEEEAVEDLKPKEKRRAPPLEPLIIPSFRREPKDRPVHKDRPLRTIFCIILLLLFFTTILTEILFTLLLTDKEWNYKNQEKWCSFSKACCEGHSQSPINIDENAAKTANQTVSVVFKDYEKAQGLAITNDGRTIKLTYDKEATGRTPILQAPWLSLDEKKSSYHFHSAHFHWGSNRKKGSEHQLNGMKFEFEMQLLHYNEAFEDWDHAINSDTKRGICVIAIAGSVKEYDTIESLKLQPIATNLFNVRFKGQTLLLKDKDFSLLDLLPPLDLKFYVYEGSLSHPHCVENVVWVVYFVTWSPENQIHLFRNMKSHCIGCPRRNMYNNFRKLQPSEGRLITVYYPHKNASVLTR